MPRHNPWTYFVNERTLCNSFDIPFDNHFAADAKAGTLPNVGMAIPNRCNDAHDCSLATADEDDKKSSNKVLTAVIHPSQKGNVVSTPLTMYSLSQQISHVSRTTPLRHAIKAASMRSAFQLPIG